MATIKMIPGKREGETNVVIMRSQYRNGTNSKLYIDGELHSYCIELPWKNNEHQVSCIPDGTYKLAKQYSKHLGHHLQVLDVPERDGIAIHPANNAKLELKGCIAPVTNLTGEGTGTGSRKAFNGLLEKVDTGFTLGNKVHLTIITPNTIVPSFRQPLKTATAQRKK
jgi:hypothetical protein